MPNGESKLRKILFNEVSFIVSIAAVIIGVVLFITRPDAQFHEDISLLKQSVEIIKSNDLKHLEAGLSEHIDQMKIMEGRLDRIEQSLVRIEALLSK